MGVPAWLGGLSEPIPGLATRCGEQAAGAGLSRCGGGPGSGAAAEAPCPAALCSELAAFHWGRLPARGGQLRVATQFECALAAHADRRGAELILFGFYGI